MNVYAKTQDQKMVNLVEKLGEAYKPASKCAEYVRRLKIIAKGIGDKPMPHLKLKFPDEWWRWRVTEGPRQNGVGGGGGIRNRCTATR